MQTKRKNLGMRFWLLMKNFVLFRFWGLPKSTRLVPVQSCQPQLPLITGKEGNAIVCKSNYGPIFGSDLNIPNAPNSHNCSVSLNNTYQCPTGQNATTFLTGYQSFTINEMEVFVFEK